MTSTGPNSPSAAANDTVPAGQDWNDVDHVFASDDTRAAETLVVSGCTHYLLATDFGFSFPLSTAILGIVVTVERKAPDADTIKDYSIKIIKDGVVSGSEKADTSIFWPINDTEKNYGNATDLWGLIWTAQDVNAADFGVAVSAKNMDAGNLHAARIDWIGITIYYQIGAKSGIAIGQPMIF